MNSLIHILEDDPAVRDSLKLLLELRGFRVDAFACGADLLNCRDATQCACIILDVDLPGDDGFKILAKLRESGVDAPAIFVSGASSHAIRLQARRTNAVAFFDKPVRPDELFKAIERALQRR